MNINFELYRIFYIVATVGNITKASEILMISQPAVTKQIKNLEEQLGGELFIRTKRGVILTDNGKEIYNYVKQAINSFTNAEMQFSNLKRLEKGTIRIGISTTLMRIFLLNYLKIFHQQYPNIAIQVFTDPSKVMRNMLKEGKIDLLIAKEELHEDEDLELIRLGKLKMTFIASDTYKELNNKVIDINDLESYPILLQKYPSTTRETFDKFCANNNIKITTKLEIASSSLLEDFVKIGLGIGLSTREFVLNELREGKIFEIKTKQKLPETYFSLILLKNSIHSFSTNKLTEIILNDLKK